MKDDIRKDKRTERGIEMVMGDRGKYGGGER